MRVEVEAPAKINLFLRVLDRRPDGFHEIDTVFQAVSLADRVVVSVDASRPSSIALEVDGPDLGAPESNLAYRAVDAFRRGVGVDGAIRVELTKRIPAGAGLGGGSSDAAAVLKCLAHATGFDDPAFLRSLGGQLGSDVPFFLGASPLARGRGRGEQLTGLEPLSEVHLVLALPAVHVATGPAYSALAAHRHGAAATRASAEEPGPAWPSSWDEVSARAVNDFEAVILGRHEEIARAHETLRAEGADPVLLSGSGAAVFGGFGDASSAEHAALVLEARCGWPFVAVTTLRDMPAVGSHGL
ncbi:MAG: 4-(cytidine 5'-diphospho)-2-C-methyl-D-erythritol kinase [Gemmatimonadota bacterium]|nr:4-(cytidine 5'-diphospho)-2-C-methyl-D-erythritol kinase [Gemmatimonadota bacterium]